MKILNRLFRLLVISAAIYLASGFLMTNPVYAKNIAGGFGAGTKIATPHEDVAVEELHPGDRPRTRFKIKY